MKLIRFQKDCKTLTSSGYLTSSAFSFQGAHWWDCKVEPGRTAGSCWFCSSLLHCHQGPRVAHALPMQWDNKQRDVTVSGRRGAVSMFLLPTREEPSSGDSSRLSTGNSSVKIKAQVGSEWGDGKWEWVVSGLVGRGCGGWWLAWVGDEIKRWLGLGWGEEVGIGVGCVMVNGWEMDEEVGMESLGVGWRGGGLGWEIWGNGSEEVEEWVGSYGWKR